MERLLEIVLTLLLAATLFHAVRLERALGVLKRDRVELEALVAGFNASTRSAEAGIERLRNAADGMGADLARQIAAATSVGEDLRFLTDRGGTVADRMERRLRAERPPERAPAPPPAVARGPEPAPSRVRSKAERDLLQALRMARADDPPGRPTAAAADDHDDGIAAGGEVRLAGARRRV